MRPIAVWRVARLTTSADDQGLLLINFDDARSVLGSLVRAIAAGHALGLTTGADRYPACITLENVGSIWHRLTFLFVEIVIVSALGQHRGDRTWGNCG